MIGRGLISVGLLLVVLGILMLLSQRFGLPLGRLPGDLAFRGKHLSIYVPVVTCLVASVLLSLLMWLINAFRR